MNNEPTAANSQQMQPIPPAPDQAVSMIDASDYDGPKVRVFLGPLKVQPEHSDAPSRVLATIPGQHVFAMARLDAATGVLQPVSLADLQTGEDLPSDQPSEGLYTIVFGKMLVQDGNLHPSYFRIGSVKERPGGRFWLPVRAMLES